MKRINLGWRAPRRISSRLALTLTFLATGCTHVASKRAKTHSQLDEHSRALTTAVVDSLQLQPREQRDNYTEFALRVAREDQRIEGLPLNPIAVEPFVQANATNSLATLQAERALSVRFAEIEKLIASKKSRRTASSQSAKRTKKIKTAPARIGPNGLAAVRCSSADSSRFAFSFRPQFRFSAEFLAGLSQKFRR